MTENIEDYPDRVAAMYKGKTIFITGGTGFMGKVLIEKLLRSCSDLKRIILMVRSKKGKHPKDRVREIFAGPLFDMVKKQKGDDIIKKVDAICGDVMLPNMGICTEDREMLINDVDIIFHCAATIRFDEPLKKAVLLNARGTMFMLDLAKECKKLLFFEGKAVWKPKDQFKKYGSSLTRLLKEISSKQITLPLIVVRLGGYSFSEFLALFYIFCPTPVFVAAVQNVAILLLEFFTDTAGTTKRRTRASEAVLDFSVNICREIADECFGHVSTAYCHLNERMLYEKPYPPPADPHHIIKTVEWLSDDLIDLMTPKLLGDIPNTYAFTKALGEALVEEQRGKLPVVIMRPSVVIPIWKEPLPGWTDNINGPTGLLIGAGKGVLRTMYCKKDSYADYVPVDIAVNAAILCVFMYIEFKNDMYIYHLTSSAEYKITMEEIINIGRKVVSTKIPLNGVAWYPGGSMKRSRIVHYICFFLFHLIPAVLVDALLIVLGYKPVLCRVQKRIWKGFEVFEYYANNQWDFDSTKSFKARNDLNPKERAIYKCDGDGINYFEYFTTCVHAARLYILKETDDTLPAARRHMQVMWVIDKLFKGIFCILAIYYLYQKVLTPLLAAYS